MSVAKDQQLNDADTFTLNPILIDFINYYMTVGRPPPVWPTYILYIKNRPNFRTQSHAQPHLGKECSLKHTISNAHDQSLYLVCPDVLRAVGDTSYGIWVWFIESHIFFTFCLFMYLCLRLKSTLIQLSKQKSYSTKRKEKKTVAFLQKLKPLFSVTTLYTTSPAPLH